jgi:hypothetical protein
MYMSIDNKLDQLLTDVATIKTITAAHTCELAEVKSKLEPVLFHVNGLKWLVKLGGICLTVLSCLAGILLLLK